MRNLETRTRKESIPITSKEGIKIDKNLKQRIRRFARDGRIVCGPIEVTRYKEFSSHYLVSFTIYGCIEDDQGGHNLGYKNKRFDKYPSKYSASRTA